MKTIATKKLGKYLFWVGPILIVMGSSAAIVSGSLGPVPLGLLITGIVLTGLWLLFQAHKTSWWEQRSTQASTNALVATISVLVILALVNFLATRYPLRVDLTENQLLTLAPESRQLVRQLHQPVKVLVFDRTPNPQDRELLLNYQRQGPEFHFEYIDPQAQPELAEKFGVKQPGEVYLAANRTRKFVQVVSPQDRLSEVQLTNAIEQLQNGSTSKVYFIQGHGERPLIAGQGSVSQALSILKDKNFTALPLNLTQQTSVPQDASVVVVDGPKQALFDREVKALSNYLNQGGSLLLLIDPNINSHLEGLLKTWGIKLDNSLVVDISGTGAGYGPAVPVVNQYGNHPITKDFGNNYSFYPISQPITVTQVPGVQATPLLLTNPYPNSWAHTNLKSQDLKFDPKTDRKGPLILGVAASRPGESKSNNKPSESRLVVFGNSTFATDGLIGQQLNSDVFLNSVSWLSKDNNQPLSIRPKQEKNRRINITHMQAILLGWTSLLLFPVIGLAAAVLLWWKRR